MHDSLSGATTNLLRMARSECRGALAFVALSLDDNLFATAAYPTVSDDDLFGEEEVEEVVQQAWADPEFGQARVFVRASRLKSRRLARPKRFVVAIVPLSDGSGGRPWGMLGVVDPESGGFEPPQLDLLEQIAQRLASHLRARQEVRAPWRPAPRPATGRPPRSRGRPRAPLRVPPGRSAPRLQRPPYGPSTLATVTPATTTRGEDEPWWSVEPGQVPATRPRGRGSPFGPPAAAADRPGPSLSAPLDPSRRPAPDPGGPSRRRASGRGRPWPRRPRASRVRRPPGADRHGPSWRLARRPKAGRCRLAAAGGWPGNTDDVPNGRTPRRRAPRRLTRPRLPRPGQLVRARTGRRLARPEAERPRRRARPDSRHRAHGASGDPDLLPTFLAAEPDGRPHGAGRVHRPGRADGRRRGGGWGRAPGGVVVEIGGSGRWASRRWPWRGGAPRRAAVRRPGRPARPDGVRCRGAPGARRVGRGPGCRAAGPGRAVIPGRPGRLVDPGRPRDRGPGGPRGGRPRRERRRRRAVALGGGMLRVG